MNLINHWHCMITLMGERSKLGYSLGGSPKAWHYYWYHGMLTNRDLSWLFSKRANKQLKELEADIYTQLIDRRCGLLWLNYRKYGRSWGDPIGRSAVSTNLDPQDLLDTEPPTRQHTLADMRPPTHIQQRTVVWTQSEKMHLTLKRDLRPQGVGCSGRGWQSIILLKMQWW